MYVYVSKHINKFTTDVCRQTSLCRSYGRNMESAPFLTLALPRGTLYRRTRELFLILCFLGSDTEDALFMVALCNRADHYIFAL